MKTTAEKIAVMQAFEDGAKVICKSRVHADYALRVFDPKNGYVPVWNWERCDHEIVQEEPKAEQPAKAREWWIIPTRSFMGHTLPPEANNAAWCEPGPECPQEGSWPNIAIHVREVLPGADDELEALRAERDRLTQELAEARDSMERAKKYQEHWKNVAESQAEKMIAARRVLDGAA